MCEILLYARVNNGNPQGYHQFDPVTVHDDGWTWGYRASKADWIAGGRLGSQWPRGFILLKIPSVPASRVRGLLQQWESTPKTLHRKRKVFFDIDAAPSTIRQKIGSDYEITVTKAQIRNFLKSKVDGVVFDPGWDA